MLIFTDERTHRHPVAASTSSRHSEDFDHSSPVTKVARVSLEEYQAVSNGSSLWDSHLYTDN
jgi:hypothetical protein